MAICITVAYRRQMHLLRRGGFRRPCRCLTPYRNALHIAPLAHLPVFQAIDAFVVPDGGAGGNGAGVGIAGGGGDGEGHKALVVTAVDHDLQGVGVALDPADVGMVGFEGGGEFGFPAARVDGLDRTDEAQGLADGVGVVAGGFDPRNQAGKAGDDAFGDGGRGFGGKLHQRRKRGDGAAGVAVAQEVLVGCPLLAVVLDLVEYSQGEAEGLGIGFDLGNVGGGEAELFGVGRQLAGDEFEQFGLAAVVGGQVVGLGHVLSP